MTVRIPVVWWPNEDGNPSRGYWDQGWLEHLVSGELWPLGLEFVDVTLEEAYAWEKGCVIVIPARWHVEDVDAINQFISTLDWCLVVLSGDEENVFPRMHLPDKSPLFGEPPRMKVWVQTPRPATFEFRSDECVGDMWPPDFPRMLRGFPFPHKNLDWSFVGQINTEPRQEMQRTLNALLLSDPPSNGFLETTSGFGHGLPYHSYTSLLIRSRVVPCPSGPFTPDSFRLFEALEAGCVPVVEAASPNYDERGYWGILFDGEPPFPVIDNWALFPEVLDAILADWPAASNRCSAWWQTYKRGLAVRFAADVLELEDGDDALPGTITVLMPTSPTPNNPDTSHIEATIESVRDQLPDAEVILMLDGVRPEQEHLRERYEEYQRRVLWLCDHHWRGVMPIRFEAFHHQAAMTRDALRYVWTPRVLFVEHDTPLAGRIDWGECERVIADDHLDVVRFHHEAVIPAEHDYLMLSDYPLPDGFLRTMQWSSRPHLARTDTYRKLLERHFAESDRTMIEDRMHSVVQSEPSRYYVGIYTPPGDSIQRSLHFDARGDEPKFEETF